MPTNRQLNPHAYPEEKDQSKVITREVAAEVFKTLRKLFKRTTPHANLIALLNESQEIKHRGFTNDAMKYWLAPFEHDKKSPELEGATRIQAYANFSLLNQIEQKLERSPYVNSGIDDAEPNHRQGNAQSAVAGAFMVESQVKELCRVRIEKTKPLDMSEVWIDELKKRKMAGDDFVIQQVLIGVVENSNLRSSFNPAKVINEAIATLAGNAWEGLDNRPNWTGAQAGVLSEHRTAARFKELCEVLEMPVFDQVGNI